MEADKRIESYKEIFSKKYSDNSVTNADNCSGFIKTVAKENGLNLPDKGTEELIDFLEKDWDCYDDKFAAFKAASEGKFVLVAARAVDLNLNTGHIAIVLPEKDRKNHHYLFGGSSNSHLRSKGENTLDYIFPKKMQHLLRYYSPGKRMSEKESG